MPALRRDIEYFRGRVAEFDAVKEGNPALGIEGAASLLGVGGSTVREWRRIVRLHEVAAESVAPARVLKHEISVEPAPLGGETMDELVARKKRIIERSLEHENWAKLIPVAVKEQKPIGILLVGDPHVDDDHCDIARLEDDLTTVGRTEGFYAGHVGDLTNNWVGRLARLYAAQSTTASDGLRLVEWMLGLCPNLFVVAGNHDMWQNGMDVLRWIVKSSPPGAGAVQGHGVRLALNWPNGESLRLHCRHDFPGASQFSDTHGMKRELLFGHRDHILVAGHRHVDEARVEPSLDGDVHWMFRVSGYKVIDEYAKENGFRAKRMSPSVAVVIDPSRSPAERVKPFWEPRVAAEYLTWLRNRK